VNRFEIYFEAQVERELRPIQFFTKSKEKEMNFRRVFTALAVLALFVSLASAQITPATQVTCTLSAPSQPSVRAEGFAERVGDLKLTCTGGLAPVAGSPADRATIVVDMGVPVTSRLEAGNQQSEALIVIDEPNALSGAAATSLGINGYGPNSALSVCGVAAAPCPTFSEVTTSGYWIMSNTAYAPGVAVPTGGAATPGANVYQGVVGTGANNTKITFTGVPLTPPVASGVQRVYRITNVRVNPSGATGPINATITSATITSGASTLAATGTQQVATSAPSLTTTVQQTAVSACVSTTLTGAAGTAKANVALLKFTESTPTAFKTRVVSTANLAGDAVGTGAAQTSVTGSYTVGANTVVNNSESGLVLPVGTITAGLADSGTRFKAVFKSLDTKAAYWVSVNPVGDFATQVTAPTVGAGDATATQWAILTNTQGSAGENAAYAPWAGATATANTGVTVAPVTLSASGNGEVVWEVTNSNPAANETFNFALYAVYSSSNAPATNPTTAATVQLGYAPTNGSTAPGVTTTWIPRFAAPAAGVTFFTVLPCQTTLLFPFVTNQSGFETGIAIGNTSMDPFGTTPAGGACAINFYGDNAPTSAVTMVNGADGATTVAAGKVSAHTVSGLGLVNFQGYGIAVCNFLYAHGFAFIQGGVGPSQMAMGYLPLVLNTSTSSVPRGSFNLGEAAAH